MTGSVHISQHPVVATKLSQLREASQSSKVTRGLVHDLATLLSYEASVDLPLTHEKTVSI
jgi:uracil phosphoribosyltransferase